MADNLLVVVATVVMTLVILINFLAWAIFESMVQADTSGMTGFWFWIGQLAVAGIAFALLYGTQPQVTVTTSPSGLRIQQGSEHFTENWDHIRSIEPISRLAFHRHFRRYTGTRVFVNRIEAEMLRLETPQATVILGLSETDRVAFEQAVALLKAPAQPVHEAPVI